ncbi:MAG: c-type cytochrome biogenesis protein CcsB [Desulfobacterota bacterium]|nr:c-type cytochrome biogenesis protein CcsB [Thermodesulfobacteriota bacterium]MDW8002079.1 c-type cytochrome biogenesis protein CcsB [Deltaproteobacteria bacterium]
MNIYIFYASLVFYLISTFFYLLYFALGREALEKKGFFFLLGGVSVHFLSLIVRYIEAGYTPITNLYESLSFLAFLVGSFFIFLRDAYSAKVLGSFILPAISIILIISTFLPHEIKPLPPILRSHYLPIHTIFSFIGHAVFFTSFMVSVLYLITESYIKKKRLPPFIKKLPSLELLDRINVRCISIGFPFLTTGIITGSLWASLAWGSYWSWDPKEVWSLITWLIYAILIHRRLLVGWMGRKTAYVMILGFLCILITFLGVNYLMGGRHSYL